MTDFKVGDVVRIIAPNSYDSLQSKLDQQVGVVTEATKHTLWVLTYAEVARSYCTRPDKLGQWQISPKCLELVSDD